MPQDKEKLLLRRMKREEKTKRVSFMVVGKAREGEPKPKAKRVSFLARR